MSKSEREQELEWQLGAAYDRIRELEELATTDELTGLGNRRALNEQIKRSLSQADRSGADLTFIAIDIDHFKQVNDTHGHDAGDEVLKRVAAALKKTTRTGDYVFRHGGEEMSVLATTSFKGAAILAEKLRTAVANSHSGNEIAVTISIGVAMARLKEDADSLYKRADEKLYQAKESGRNRVEI